MATKTNKSYTKRIKVTKNGKVKIRKVGQNHFNAKQSGKKRMSKKTPVDIKLPKKVLKRFIPHK